VLVERRADGVAELRLDNPKVNARSAEVLRQLTTAAEELRADPPGAVEEFLMGLWDRYGRQTAEDLLKAIRADGAFALAHKRGANTEITVELMAAGYGSDSGQAEAAPGLAGMARQFGLAFLPTVVERFDLVVDRHAWFEPPFQRLLAFCASGGFAAKAAELGGYDLAGHGRGVWNAP